MEFADVALGLDGPLNSAVQRLDVDFLISFRGCPTISLPRESSLMSHSWKSRAAFTRDEVCS